MQADLQQKHPPQKCTLEQNSFKTMWKFNGVWHPSFLNCLSEAIWWPASLRNATCTCVCPRTRKCAQECVWSVMCLANEGKQVPDQNKFLVQCIAVALLLAGILAPSSSAAGHNEGNHVSNRGSSRQWSHKVIHASHRSQIAAASQPHRRKTYRHLARLLQKSVDASKSRYSPWAKGQLDLDCCAECIDIQSPGLGYVCYGGQSMEGGSRTGELRKLSSSLSPATPSKLAWTSLSQLSWEP